jgi:acetyl-CoA C-acetyltransferase
MTVDVFLVGGVRTPHGRYGGSLRDIPVVALGALAGRAAVERAGVPVQAIGEVVVSNCRQAGNGPNPGRQMALRAGVPEPVPAMTINMACASGLKAVALAHASVASGTSEVALAIAAESMSRMPYLGSHELRWGGVKRGDIVLRDGWKDGGTDPICDMNMGQTAEKLAASFGVERAAQDEWSARSHERVAAAWHGGRFDGEVVPVEIAGGGLLERDETFRETADRAKLATLKPSFSADGTVTAGNSSQMADGAAALVLASADAASAHGLTPRAVLRSFAAVGVDPTIMGVGPAHAIPKALELAGVAARDIDLFEINEAFAAQIVQNVRALALDEDRVNVNGGGIALGHPTGQSGCRLLVTLLAELERRDGTLGVASLCVGGGIGVAAVIERMS